MSFVLLIPIINILADILTNYFPAATMNPGSLRAFILAIFIFHFLKRAKKLDNVSKFILTYVIYLFVLTLFSSNIFFSMMIFTKVAIALMMFPIGYYYIDSIDNFRKLNLSYAIVIIIIVVSLLISNVFKLGTSDYAEGTFYFGSSRVNITKTLAILLLCTPFIISMVKDKHHWIWLFLIIGLVFVFIGVKRGAVSALVVGTIIFFLLTPRKGKIIKLATITVILLALASPIYYPILTERVLAREDRLELHQESLESQGRYNEIFLVLDAFEKGNLLHKLFGSEIFNEREFFSTRRMLHTDYFLLLNGSGMVGILFFFGVYWKIILEKNRYFKDIYGNKFYGELNAVFWAIIAAMLILSISGTVHAIGSRAFMLMYLGAIVRLMREKYRTNVLLKENVLNNQSILRNKLT